MSDSPSTAAPQFRVFINYRRDDSDAAALLLYDRLVRHLGAENVFLDVKALEVGSRWLEEIKSHGVAGTVFLSLIGRGWLASLKERQRDTEGPPDFVALELELALSRWPGRVIPVLVGGATMPPAVELPRPIRALAGHHAMELRHASFDQDVTHLLATLDAIASGTNPDMGVSASKTAPGGDVGASARQREDHSPNRASARARIASADVAHFETVLGCMVEEGTVVPVLGSGLWGALPDSGPLAAYLADTFRLRSASQDLAAVAQHVAVAKGPSFLFRAMRDILAREPEPNDVHAFLARFPGRLAAMGLPPRYQMIVTTNYDTALERAFGSIGEPNDLAVFLASGPDKGKFIHVPWSGESRLIAEPSRYRGFPIDPFDELERTLIVKVHGAADGGEGDYRWDRNYVLTEDHYIDYLLTDQIGSVIPLQILNKLTSSHCLFLGYAMRDWSLRVFLKRVWHGSPLEDKSWAIERDPDALEKDFWNALHVELLAAAPDAYTRDLNDRLAGWRGGGA